MKKIAAAVIVSAIAWCASVHAGETHLTKMQGYSEIQRNLAFGMLVMSSGAICNRVTHSFVRGEDDAGVVYITIRCQDGEDHLILEGGERKGATVLTCAQAAVIMQGLGLPTSCWIPL